MKRLLYIFLPFLLLTACNVEENVITPTEEGGPELRSVSATIGGIETRASGNSDYVGRQKFVENDIMVLTKMQRTVQPLASFTYNNIRYKSNADQAWDRDMVSGYYDQDRIYWSDNASPHTFIGYSTPLSWVNGAGYKDNKWESTSDGFYTGQFTKNSDNIVDFTAIIPDETDPKKRIDANGQKLKEEDILLAYDDNMHADPGGLTTTVHFKHALASLRVIIDINEFAPSSSSKDTLTTISDLEVLNQPWKYIWKQQSWGVENNTQDSDGKVTLKAWQPRPAGEGLSQAKRFTFYSLIVPGDQSDFSVKYKVRYPNATNPTGEYKENTYKATIQSIKFLAGYCTTLKVSLNHEGEPVIIGAEYIDWENVETPDRSELQKVSTYLDVINRRNDQNEIVVSIATDQVNGANISIDDATWLYIDGKDSNKLKDIYGNDGDSEATAYQIKSARQFLSFMYEVNEGKRSFEDKYIKLETGLYLQPGTTTGEKKNSDGSVIVNDLDTSKLLSWPGIGTSETAFNGTFLGGVRLIKRLYGNPLFNSIGPKGHIEQLLLEDVLGITGGGGAFAGVNNGVICAGKVASINTWTFNVTNTVDYAGAFVGVNNGIIMTCYSTGAFKSTAAKTGGLVGKNTGAIVVSYAANRVTSTATSPVYGGIVADNSRTVTGVGESAVTTLDGVIFCFFCRDNWTDPDQLPDNVPASVKAMTTIEMQKEDFIGDPASTNTNANTLNGAINYWSTHTENWPTIIKDGLTTEQITSLSAHFANRYYTYHVATFPWVY